MKKRLLWGTDILNAPRKNPRSIRDTISATMELYGIDYKDLAFLTGLPRQTCWRYWKGKQDLTGARLDMVFAALDIRLVRPSRLTQKQMVLRGAARRATAKKKEDIVVLTPDSPPKPQKRRSPKQAVAEAIGQRKEDAPAPVCDRKKYADREGWQRHRKPENDIFE